MNPINHRLLRWDASTSINRSALLRAGGVALCLAGAILSNGCFRRTIVVQAPPATVIQNPAPVVSATATPPVVVLKEAPPPPRYEAMSPQPSSDTVWIPGYWMWRAGQQEWVSGHWETPPRPGARWVSSRWERQGDGYIFIQGYWQ